jgi:hypothetical protein
LGHCRGAKIEIELGLNCGSQAITVAGSVYTGAVPSFNRNSVCPFQISPIDRGIATGAANENELKVLCKMGHDGAQQPILYVKKMIFNPEQTSLFKEIKLKTINYFDYYTKMSKEVSSQDSLPNDEIFSSVSKARYLVIIPQYSFALKPEMSPFSSSPVTSAPYAKIGNLQVYKSQNTLFERPIEYGFEHYQQQLLNIMSLNGANASSPYTSGQITKDMFDKAYGYHVVDLSIGKTSGQDAISHSYSISLVNRSKFPCRYLFLLYFERSMRINPQTSEIIV